MRIVENQNFYLSQQARQVYIYKCWYQRGTTSAPPHYSSMPVLTSKIVAAPLSPIRFDARLSETSLALICSCRSVSPIAIAPQSVMEQLRNDRWATLNARMKNRWERTTDPSSISQHWISGALNLFVNCYLLPSHISLFQFSSEFCEFPSKRTYLR